jgi:hypothetical protein
MTMILVGAAYFSAAQAAITWDTLAGAAMFATGAVAIVLGIAIIGIPTIVTRARHLARSAAKTRRP